MREFRYHRAKDVPDALAKQKARRILAGGTGLIDLMKLEVETPAVVTDVTRLPWRGIETTAHGLHVGALVTNADLAAHPRVRADYPALSEAILAGASAQLRNKATTAGNLLQRTRCTYFRDPHQACNKREPGAGCGAIDGVNRSLAILGTSDRCIATNPSDMNVALVAFEAKIHLKTARAERIVDVADFHVTPGTTPHVETILGPEELVTGVTLPTLEPGTRSFYLKLRDRASYEFALASVAMVTRVVNGRVIKVRFAMGGIATKPWRVPAAEAMLEGTTPTPATIAAAVTRFLDGARAQSHNGFKIELAKRCLTKALNDGTKA